jgi:hypothetical protein
MNTRRNRVFAAAAAAAIALTSLSFTPADARPVGHRYGNSGYGNRAALGAVLGVFGTIATLAARDHYRDQYGYGYGPGYGYGGYAPPPRAYYGPYGYRY